MARSDFLRTISSPAAAYAEGLAFFRGKGMLNRALKRLAKDLDRLGIDYSVIGAIALNQHGYRRFTEVIELVMMEEGLERVRAELVGRGYRPAFPGANRKFRVADENVPLEIMLAGTYPGDGRPKPVEFPVPSESQTEIDGIRTVPLETLIELKLASGMTMPDRLKDLADVQELIRRRSLTSELSERLNPYVRDKYLELCRSVEAARGIATAEPSDL